MGNVAVLLVGGADTEVAAGLIGRGHQVTCANVEASTDAVRAQLVSWISDGGFDAIAVCGGIADEVATEALAPLITAPLAQPAMVLRQLAYDEVGSAAML